MCCSFSTGPKDLPPGAFGKPSGDANGTGGDLSTPIHHDCSYLDECDKHCVDPPQLS